MRTTIILLSLILLVATAIPVDASEPVYWIIGPTAAPDTYPPLINNTAMNATNLALFGADPTNYTLTNASVSSVGGGLTAMFGDMGPWVVLLIVGACGAIIYIGNDGDFTPISYLLIISGATTGGGAFAFALPGMYYVVGAFMLGLGIASMFYLAWVGKG